MYNSSREQNSLLNIILVCEKVLENILTLSCYATIIRIVLKKKGQGNKSFLLCPGSSAG